MCPRKGRAMMQRTTLAAIAALVILSGCKEETIVGGRKDDMAEELAKAPKVVLPPALKSSLAYRCKDGSLVYVDLFQGDKMANLRTAKDGPPIKLEAPEAGQAMVAEGYSITASESGLTVAQPGKAAQTCKA